MAPKSTASGQGGSGKGLSRDTIVDTGLRLIDRDGAQTLTMRSLAHELDVVPMALYRYVHGREDLLEAVVALLLEGVRRDLDDETEVGAKSKDKGGKPRRPLSGGGSDPHVQSAGDRTRHSSRRRRRRRRRPAAAGLRPPVRPPPRSPG